MRTLLFFSFLLIAGCEEPEEDLDGVLVRVQVDPDADECAPARFVGDAGVQFFGQRADGGAVFTMGQHAQFGPTLDGGVLPGVQRQAIPSPNGGLVTLGAGTDCNGRISNWERTADGLLLDQLWPGIDLCPTGPDWLPAVTCGAQRRFTFTEVGTCQLRCVRISPTSGEVECSC